MKHLHNLIRALSSRKQLQEIDIEQEDLLTTIIGKKRTEQLWFCTLLALALCYLIFLVSTAIFLIYDVILYRNDIHVSHTGALMPQKACHCEQALFLFNTSQLWADSGISVHKGDEIKISASGAFHSSLPELVRAAKKNIRPTYIWLNASSGEQRFLSPETGGSGRNRRGSGAERTPSEEAGSPSGEENASSDSSECIVPTTRFGAVLYQIHTEAQPCIPDPAAAGRSDRIHVLTPQDGRQFQRIRENGTLYFAINDIFLTDSIIELHAKQNLAMAERTFAHATQDQPNEKGLLVKNEVIEQFLAQTGCNLYYRKNADTLYYAGDTFREHFRSNRDVWFNDNIGQIAISVDIRRHIPFYSHSIWYRELESRLNTVLNEWREVSFWRTVGRFVLLLVEFLIGIPLMFTVSSLLATAVIYYLSKTLLWIIDWIISAFLRQLHQILSWIQRKKEESNPANE